VVGVCIARAIKWEALIFFEQYMWHLPVVKHCHMWQCRKWRIALFIVVGHVLTVDVQFGSDEFLFVFSLFFGLEIHVNHSKNRLCPSICISFNFDSDPFDYYLFLISSQNILFHLIFLFNLTIILFFFFFMFYSFLDFSSISSFIFLYLICQVQRSSWWKYWV
jgi:hypothetical protein